MSRLPWITLATGLLAVALHLVPGAGTWLEFNRDAVARGEVWRLLSGHLVHFNGSHLGWDLFGWLLLGTAAECRRQRFAHLGLLLVGAAGISAAVWIGNPELLTYRGLSGLDSLLFATVLVEAAQSAWRRRDYAFLAAMLAVGCCFAAKCVAEQISASPVFAAGGGDFVPVPLAHLAGAVIGAASAIDVRRAPLRLAQMHHNFEIVFGYASVRRSGGAPRSRFAPTKSARQGASITPLSVMDAG